jgi:hypothetical protein
MAFAMKKYGLDIHAVMGGSGFIASVIVAHWNEIAGACAAFATAVYMSLRATREWVRLRRELRSKELKDESKNEN